MRLICHQLNGITPKSDIDFVLTEMWGRCVYVWQNVCLMILSASALELPTVAILVAYSPSHSPRCCGSIQNKFCTTTRFPVKEGKTYKSLLTHVWGTYLENCVQCRNDDIFGVMKTIFSRLCNIQHVGTYYGCEIAKNVLKCTHILLTYITQIK